MTNLFMPQGHTEIYGQLFIKYQLNKSLVYWKQNLKFKNLFNNLLQFNIYSLKEKLYLFFHNGSEIAFFKKLLEYQVLKKKVWNFNCSYKVSQVWHKGTMLNWGFIFFTTQKTNLLKISNDVITNKVCWQYRFSWLFLTIHPYQPSLLISPLGGIQCPHRADEWKFLLAS